MVLSATLSLFGLGFLCWILFSLAVHALPAFVAVSVFQLALASDAGPVGAILVALFSGALTLVLGQIALATIRSLWFRLALAVLFALPAGIAGFHVIRGLAEIGGASEPWTMAFAGIGALAVGATAWAQVAALAGPEEAQAPPVGVDGWREIRDG
jgi:hypothetical protein